MLFKFFQLISDIRPINECQVVCNPFCNNGSECLRRTKKLRNVKMRGTISRQKAACKCGDPQSRKREKSRCTVRRLHQRKLLDASFFRSNFFCKNKMSENNKIWKSNWNWLIDFCTKKTWCQTFSKLRIP